MKAKISKIKFFNSVKAGSKGGVNSQLDYVDTAVIKLYDISVEDIFIKIYNKETEELTYTTVHNVVYFSIMD
jgi:hypothetical protein